MYTVDRRLLSYHRLAPKLVFLKHCAAKNMQLPQTKMELISVPVQKQRVRLVTDDLDVCHVCVFPASDRRRSVGRVLGEADGGVVVTRTNGRIIIIKKSKLVSDAATHPATLRFSLKTPTE
jgi:hypothetical protein